MLAVNPNRRILSVVVTTCDSFRPVLTVFRDCCGNAPHGLVRRSQANALDPNTRAANGPPPNAAKSPIKANKGVRRLCIGVLGAPVRHGWPQIQRELAFERLSRREDPSLAQVGADDLEVHWHT